MARNEKYIAYTRALSELILVVDDKMKPEDPVSADEYPSETTSANKDDVIAQNTTTGVTNSTTVSDEKELHVVSSKPYQQMSLDLSTVDVDVRQDHGYDQLKFDLD